MFDYLMHVLHIQREREREKEMVVMDHILLFDLGFPPPSAHFPLKKEIKQKWEIGTSEVVLFGCIT